MKKVFALFAFLCTVSFAETYVAVLEAVAKNNVMDYDELLYLTDNLRERAGKVLPSYMGYVIMTRENISAMLPPGKSIEECYGECLATTGANIAADYVSGARVGKFGSEYTLTVELYETRGNKLIGSFTTRKPDADGLLKEIERRADELFKQVQNDRSGVYGSVNSEKAKMVEVSIETTPARAMVSVDGKPLCPATPCKVKVAEGSRQLSFVLDEYFDKDTVVKVSAASKIKTSLDPKFGVLVLAPVMTDSYGKVDEVEVTVDGQSKKGTELRLDPGKHSVKLQHRCYEPIAFTVGVQSGSRVTFAEKLDVAMGGLKLSARRNGAPVEESVTVNGNSVGMTPFYEKVPLCGNIKVGGQPVKVNLKYHESVTYTKELD